MKHDTFDAPTAIRQQTNTRLKGDHARMGRPLFHYFLCHHLKELVKADPAVVGVIADHAGSTVQVNALCGVLSHGKLWEIYISRTPAARTVPRVYAERVQTFPQSRLVRCGRFSTEAYFARWW